MKRLFALLLSAALLLLLLPAGAFAASEPFTPAMEAMLENLRAAIQARETALDTPDSGVWPSEMQAIANELSQDPELYYFSHFSYSYYDNSTVTRVELRYYEQYGEAERAAFEAAVSAALREVKPGMSELQAAIVFHEYLTQRVAYDSEGLASGNLPDEDFSAYGALVLGKAVCQGYAQAYRLLLGRCGIESRYVASEAMDHGWAQIRLSGNWYHVDVTWDDPVPDIPGQSCHSFLLLSDAAMAKVKSDSGRAHYAWESDYPCTDTTYDSGILWEGVNTPLCFTDADTVWYLRAEGSGPEQTISLLRRDWSTGAEAVAAAVGDYWPSWGDGNSYWMGAYAGLALWQGRLYLSDKSHIYRFDEESGALETLLTYGCEDGYFYGLAAGDDGLLVQVSTGPMDSGTIYRYVPEDAPVNPFTDVFAADPYYEAVLWALSSGVTDGVTETSFAPAGTCTRAQVVTFLWRAMGKPAPVSRLSPFTDVAADAWYHDAVLWAVEQGITDGTGEGIFSPADTCSYAHILTFLWRAMTGNAASAYGKWYEEPLDWAAENGVLRGTALGTSQADILDDCPRSAVVSFLWRCAA